MLRAWTKMALKTAVPRTSGILTAAEAMAPPMITVPNTAKSAPEINVVTNVATSDLMSLGFRVL